MVPISPQVYSAEAVTFDTKPLFDYMQRLDERRAKRALAEQEAIENYLKELPKSINPAGMAVNDIPDYLAMQKEFRQLSNKYKSTKNPLDKIAVDNKADEMLLHVSKSKDKVKKSEQPTATLADPNKKGKVDFTSLSSALDFHNLPIKDPKRKEITSLSPYFFPEQFDEVGTFNEAAKGIKESELGTTIVKGEKIIPVGYNENAVRSIAENYVKLIDINPTGINYYKGKLENLPAEKIAEAVARVKKYYPKLEIDDDEPSFLKLSDAIKAAEQRTSQKIENVPTSSGGFGYMLPFGMGVEGNAFDEITNIVGTKKGVVVKDGVANLNGVPYTGKLVMLGNEIPESVRSPLKSIGYKFQDTEQVDVNMVNGKIESIQALGRTSSKQPARRKSLVSRSTMQNAQLKFSTEPQKGPQMQFGQGLAPQTPTFTFPGGKPIKF